MSILVFCMVASIGAAIALIVAYCITDEEIFEVVGCLFAFLAFILIIVFSINAWEWTAAKYKTEIMNREYGTSYTREEVFYADDVIETIRQLNRTRIEINGNLVNGESKVGE